MQSTKAMVIDELYKGQPVTIDRVGLATTNINPKTKKVTFVKAGGRVTVSFSELVAAANYVNLLQQKGS